MQQSTQGEASLLDHARARVALNELATPMLDHHMALLGRAEGRAQDANEQLPPLHGAPFALGALLASTHDTHPTHTRSAFAKACFSVAHVTAKRFAPRL